jgi:hypothetical protein
LDLHKYGKYIAAVKSLHFQYDSVLYFRESEVQSIPSLQVLKELNEQSQESYENSVSHWLQLSVQVCDTYILQLVSLASVYLLQSLSILLIYENSTMIM